MLTRGGILSWGINFPVLAVGGNEKCIFHHNCILVFGEFFETAAKGIESGKAGGSILEEMGGIQKNSHSGVHSC